MTEDSLTQVETMSRNRKFNTVLECKYSNLNLQKLSLLCRYTSQERGLQICLCIQVCVCLCGKPVCNSVSLFLWRKEVGNQKEQGRPEDMTRRPTTGWATWMYCICVLTASFRKPCEFCKEKLNQTVPELWESSSYASCMSWAGKE